MSSDEFADMVVWLRQRLTDHESAVRYAPRDDARATAMIQAVRLVLAVSSQIPRASNSADNDGYRQALDQVLRILAEPYAQAPGYDETWKAR